MSRKQNRQPPPQRNIKKRGATNASRPHPTFHSSALTEVLARTLAEGLAHHQAGRLAEAHALYNRVLTERPDHPEALYLLGVSTFQAGRLVEAEVLLRKAIATQKGAAAWHTALGAALRGQGRLAEALDCYDHALKLDATDPNTHYNRGNALQGLERIAEAEESFRQAIRLGPAHKGARTNLGLLLAGRGRAAEAAPWLEGVVAAHPGDATALANLALCRLEQGLSTEAEAIARQAIASEPRHALSWYMLGQTLKAQHRFGEAVKTLRQAHEFDPSHVETLNSLGNALGSLGDTPGAIAAFDRALALAPNHVDAAFNRGLAYLMLGDYQRGWPGYALRWKTSILRAYDRRFSKPAWNGEPLGGKTILLYAEQGLGDTLQFVRYVPLVQARGGRVIIEAQNSLIGLLTRMPEVAAGISMGAPLPPFDVHCSIPTLPQVFGTSVATIPAAMPYLTSDFEQRRKWRERLNQAAQRKLKVGLVWAGNPSFRFDRLRSPRLGACLPLFEVQGVQIFGLQMGEGRQDLKDRAMPSHFTDLGPEIGDFSDTAAIMDELDLVISSCTAPAHLAGALGRPTWIILPLAPDWRWMQNRSDSPWYPSVRLFRQTQIGDWETPVKAVCAALAARAATE